MNRLLQSILHSWKTYRNERYGFEFRYPAAWKEELGHNNPLNDSVIVNFQDIEFQGDVEIVHASVSVEVKERSLDFANQWRQMRDASGQDTVRVAGRKALKVADSGGIVYSVLSGSTEYDIVMQAVNEKNSEGYQSIFTKILSTFNFI